MDTSPVDSAFDILRRRRWHAIVPFSVLLTVTLGLFTFLPNIYTTGAFILVEGQQIPEMFVPSTVTMGVESRLQMISQEILSRSRLEELIKEFRLYEDLQRREPMDEVIAAMRRDIAIEIKTIDPQRRRAQDTAAIAFSVSYRGTDPRKVTLVANALASFYVEENLKVRERQAAGTTEFLAVQLDEVKKKLEDQEREIARYKEQYMGQLPQEVDVNLKTLERLQAQMQTVSDMLARAEERRSFLARLIADGEPAAAPGSLTGPDTLAARFEALTRELAELRTRYSDKYPDVIRVKGDLAALEAELKQRSAEQPRDDAGTSARPYMTRTQIQQRETETEIRIGKADLVKIKKAIEIYQARVEAAPKREQELATLTRDYTSTRDLYGSLLKRRSEASLAGSMEERQKGEQFRIIDPATFPQQASSKERMRLLLLGVLASLGAGAAGVLLREKLDTSFHRLEDLKAFTATRVLVAIPRIVTEDDHARERWRRRTGIATLAVSLLLLVVGSYVVAAGNEQLIRYLSAASAGGLQLR